MYTGVRGLNLVLEPSTSIQQYHVVTNLLTISIDMFATCYNLPITSYDYSIVGLPTLALLYRLLASYRIDNSEIGYISTQYSQQQSLKTTRLNMMKSFLVHPAATSSTRGRLRRNAVVLVLTFAFLCAALASGKTLREPHAEASSTCPCQVTLTDALITREVELAQNTQPLLSKAIAILDLKHDGYFLQLVPLM